MIMMMMMVVMATEESRGLTEGGKGVYEITQKVPERSEILFMSVGARICYGLVVCSHIK
jgi:hypothetical protein